MPPHVCCIGAPGIPPGIHPRIVGVELAGTPGCRKGCMTGCCCCCITGLQSAGPQVGTQGAGPEAACPQGPQGAGSGPHGPQGLIPQGVIDVIVWPILGIIPMMGRGGPIIAGTGGKVCGIWPSGPGTKPSTHCHDMAATSAAHTTSLCQKKYCKVS